MTSEDLMNAARAHARTGRIEYAIYVGRCELCEATMTWMGRECCGFHACDYKEQRNLADLPPTGRHGNISVLGHLQLSEAEFLECRDIAMEALGTKRMGP